MAVNDPGELPVEEEPLPNEVRTSKADGDVVDDPDPEIPVDFDGNEI